MSISNASGMGRIARWGTRLTLVAAVSVGVVAQTTGVASAFSADYTDNAYSYDAAYEYTPYTFGDYTDNAYGYGYYWYSDSGAYTQDVPDGYTDFSRYYGDDYPYSTPKCDFAGGKCENDPWGFTKQQCVSFVAWRLSQRGITVDGATYGDAGNWASAAENAGYAVDGIPAVGAVAQWGSGETNNWTDANGGTHSITAGPQGHVAYVTAVHADGTVDIEEYNQGGDQSYHQEFSVNAPHYIHF